MPRGPAPARCRDGGDGDPGRPRPALVNGNGPDDPCAPVRRPAAAPMHAEEDDVQKVRVRLRGLLYRQRRRSVTRKDPAAASAQRPERGCGAARRPRRRRRPAREPDHGGVSDRRRGQVPQRVVVGALPRQAAEPEALLRYAPAMAAGAGCEGRGRAPRGRRRRTEAAPGGLELEDGSRKDLKCAVPSTPIMVPVRACRSSTGSSSRARGVQDGDVAAAAGRRSRRAPPAPSSGA